MIFIDVDMPDCCEKCGALQSDVSWNIDDRACGFNLNMPIFRDTTMRQKGCPILACPYADKGEQK